MKYKCIRSYCSGEWLTKGKIYECIDGDFKYDDGFVSWNWSFKNSSFEKAHKMNYYLEKIKEDKIMKREFKVGDIIKGTHSYKYTWTNQHMTKGEVVDVKCGFRNSEIKVKIIEHTKNPSQIGMLHNVDPKYFELIDNIPKTITITTSDTTTTLTDGIHTTTINRYHTNKHDEQIAVNSVIDKYYDELKQIEKLSKSKRIVTNNSRQTDYGIIGEKSDLIDSVGRELFVGDVVKVYDKNGKFIANNLVVKTDGIYAIMGCVFSTKNNSKENFNYIKEMSYEEINNDNRIWKSDLIIKGLEVVR